MRKLIFASCLLMGLAGCQTTTLETDVERKPVAIRFGGFDIEVTTHSRATLADACTALRATRCRDVAAGNGDHGALVGRFAATLAGATIRIVVGSCAAADASCRIAAFGDHRAARDGDVGKVVARALVAAIVRLAAAVPAADARMAICGDRSPVDDDLAGI